jgi:hypothetical protein
MAASQAEKDRLFRQVRHQLGSPLRKIEIPDEVLVTLLELSIEDYAEYVQNWLIDSQWSSFIGHHIDNVDMAFAITTRTLDFETQFTYAYSKQVGLQARGPWELKKDFIEIEAGRQVYEIPAGREVNQVLWFTPSVTNRALFANFGGFDNGIGGGYAQTGFGGGGAGSGAGSGGMGGRGGYYIAPAFDVLLTAADMNLKHRLLRSDLVYKLTAGPNGTRLLHLISTPGSKLNFGMGLQGGGMNGASSLGLAGCYVWYHYYDATDDVDACRAANSDIITLPNEVPLSRMDFDNLNEPTKIMVRQILTARAKMALGRVRGKFGGIVGPPEAERTMDWESLLSEGNEDYGKIFERLAARLEQMTNTKMLERKASEAENLNKAMKYRPMGFYVI